LVDEDPVVAMAKKQRMVMTGSMDRWRLGAEATETV
jgi:hypothetical protein